MSRSPNRRNNRGTIRPKRTVLSSLVSGLQSWWNAEPEWPWKGKGPKKEDLEYVYLFTDATQLYKIGKTNNLHRRVTGRTRSPSLRIVGYIPTEDSRDLEKQIHLDLGKYRIKGTEWFRYNPKDPLWKYWMKAFGKDTDPKILEELNEGAWMGGE